MQRLSPASAPLLGRFPHVLNFRACYWVLDEYQRHRFLVLLLDLHDLQLETIITVTFDTLRILAMISRLWLFRHSIFVFINDSLYNIQLFFQILTLLFIRFFGCGTCTPLQMKLFGYNVVLLGDMHLNFWLVDVSWSRIGFGSSFGPYKFVVRVHLDHL